MSFTNLLTSVTAGPFPWIQITDTVLKASLLLGGAGMAALALRRASASVRHLIWTVALAGSIAVPALSVALPRWRVNVVPLPAPLDPAAAADYQAPVRPAARPGVPGSLDGAARLPDSLPQQSAAIVAPAAGSFRQMLQGMRWDTIVVGLWLVGFLIVATRLALGLCATQWIARKSPLVASASWLPLARRLASDLAITAQVKFLRGPSGTMPMAWGLLRPTVLMPADADSWPVDRLRIVLLHELAHVGRRDCLTHLVAQAACALYWFHPLAWIAARRARAERERACDDLVLASGTRGSDYAEELLHIARVMRSGRVPAVLAGAGLAMAQRSQLEGRLLAILDPAVPRGGLTRARVLTTCLACCAGIMPLAALEPWTREMENVQVNAVPVPGLSALQLKNVPPPPSPRGGAPRVAVAGAQDRNLSPAVSPDQHVLPADMQSDVEIAVLQGISQGVTDGIAEGAQEIVESAVESALAPLAIIAVQVALGQQPARGPDPNPNPNPKPSSSAGRSKPSDPRTVAALTAALKDTDKEVRETAMQALVRMRDPSIFEPLVDGLRDASADVREQAAFGLGQLRDLRAVEPLVGAIKDVNGSVREQAVFALGQLGDARATEALAAALKDALADVREQAAFSLGQIRDRRGVDPLVAALKDSDTDVRQQAAFALGRIREPASVEALVMALKDSDAEVREQVAFALGHLRDPRAMDALTTALKDASATVRQRAAFALGQLAR